MSKTAPFFIMLLALLVPVIVPAHQEGAKFSGALIDSLTVHHAHIEDEQRLNFSFLKDFENDRGEKGGFSTSLELAVDWSKEFRWGSEILIPLANNGADGYGLMDIEVWPIKYAFVNKPETIFTGVISATLPTGDKSRGLGGENTGLGLLFFLDHASRNWYWGVNTEIETIVSGENETAFEFASVVAYSFIRDTGTAIAPSNPSQKFVPAALLEIVSESVLSGSAKGENVLSINPGLSLWFPSSGWAFRIGAEIPISKDKNQEYSILFSFGNHISWGDIF